MATEAGSARILGDRASASPPTTATNAAPVNANVAPGDNRDFIAFMSTSSGQQLLQRPPDDRHRRQAAVQSHLRVRRTR
jgi:hypothetical protein